MTQKARDIRFVNDNSGDWAGLYVDGKLTLEGHSLEPDDVLTVLGFEYRNEWVDMDGSRLPLSLADALKSK